ncbi:MAG TPA: glycerol-3-phosphate 1-O-acyltransferase PlsY [Gammaproteobacteria bacterium]|nr:glycerol-3-phosphate 1-O-acyltransferase PlsY [Gammaproteobacteria bacterium]
MLTLIIFCLLAYAIGSLSSAVIVCRLAGLPDPRNSGSKNPGATNVLRLGSKKAAIATLFGDVLKGFIPVFIAMHINSTPQFVGLVMLAAFLGHLYPVFFGFKGGKGVATAVGTLFALSVPLGLFTVATWGIIVYCSRLSSLAALVAALLSPIYTFWLLNTQYTLPVFIMSVFLFWRHRANIQRLLRGTEPKIGSL